MEQAQRDTRVARVDQAALALDQYDVVVLRALEHELFSGTGDEVGDHRVHRDAPPFDENPGLPGRDEAGAMATLHERIAQLELRRHLADVAVTSDRQHDQRVHLGSATIGDRQIRWGPARIEDPHAACCGERGELRIIADEGVQATPDLELLVERTAEPGLPFVGKPSAGGRDPDHHRRGSVPLCDATLEIADHGNVAAEAENVLRRLSRLRAVQHRHDALGEIANAGIGGLGCQRPEVAVGDDQEAMLGNRHFLETTAWRRSTPLHGSVGRSTAGLKRPCSP